MKTGRNISRFFIFLIALSVACERPDARPAPDGVAPSVGESAISTGTAASSRAAPMTWVPSRSSAQFDSSVDRDEVEALIQRWLDAQNRGDFEAYSHLYDDVFEGLTVSAATSNPHELDRQSWLNSERRRFERPMKVSVEDVQIDTFAESAEVLFVENRETVDRRYEGPKELFVVRQGDELRIAAEVMIESRAFEAEREASAPDPAELGLVLNEGQDEHQESYLVIDTEPEPDWFGEEIEYKGTTAARSPVIADTFPGDLMQWQNRSVDLFDADGNQCTGAVAGLYGLSRAIPHFGQIAHWGGTPGAHGEPLNEPATEEVIADGVWELGNRPLAVARLELDDDCVAEPVWGRAMQGDATPLESVELADYEQDAVLAAFRELDRYRSIQNYFLEQDDTEMREQSDGSWSTHWSAEPRIDAYRSSEHDRIFVMVSAQAGVGCGGFYGELAQLFEVRNGGDVPWVVEWGDFNEYMESTAMVDVNGDGIPAVLGNSRRWGHVDYLLSSTGVEHRLVEKLDVPSHDCGC